jgi:DNA-binding HxlR family transcriptional regulator
LDVVGDRWSLLIVRDLLGGALGFNDLGRGLPGLSRGLLAARLRKLEAARVVGRDGQRYCLTDRGRQLEPVVMTLASWGAQHTFGEPDPSELDPSLLVWWMHGRIDTAEMADRRHVIHLRFRGPRAEMWLIVERGEISVCLSDPGYPVDVVVASDVSVLYQVWMGRRDLAAAVRSGDIELIGSRECRNKVIRGLLLHPTAPLIRAAG